MASFNKFNNPIRVNRQQPARLKDLGLYSSLKATFQSGQCLKQFEIAPFQSVHKDKDERVLWLHKFAYGLRSLFPGPLQRTPLYKQNRQNWAWKIFLDRIYPLLMNKLEHINLTGWWISQIALILPGYSFAYHAKLWQFEKEVYWFWQVI